MNLALQHCDQVPLQSQPIGPPVAFRVEHVLLTRQNMCCASLPSQISRRQGRVLLTLEDPGFLLWLQRSWCRQ
jgi:hypothetical protein